jgi:hypothetical protein
MKFNLIKRWHLENLKEKSFQSDMGMAFDKTRRKRSFHSEKSEESLISIDEGISIRKENSASSRQQRQ